jgi:hypothetical protein
MVIVVVVGWGAEEVEEEGEERDFIYNIYEVILID